MEYQNKLDMAIRKKVIRPITDGLKHNIELLNKEKRVKHSETIDFFNQSYLLLKTSERLLDESNIIGYKIIARSAFEFLLMGTSIQFKDETYEEYKKIDINYNERDETKPDRLIYEFKKHLNNLNPELFKLINGKEKNKLLSDIYDKLCDFTHGSVFISMVSQINNPKVK